MELRIYIWRALACFLSRNTYYLLSKLCDCMRVMSACLSVRDPAWLAVHISCDQSC